MNAPEQARVFVLDTPRGRPHELALRGAGMQPPALAAALRQSGAAAVVVLSQAGGRHRHWLDAAHASGWIEADHAPAGDDFLPAWQANIAEGHVAADAALLAWPQLPRLTWGDEAAPAIAPRQADGEPPLGLYAIVDNVAALRRVLEAGVRTVQLRIKRPADADAAWEQGLRRTLAEGLAAAKDPGAQLFVNDHWRLAAELGAAAVHLGQEDLLALGTEGRAALRASGVALGISSHAVWELCRARSLAPRYVACGPVWPTTTKDMPWRPQGLDNLAWWCRVAGAPVVAIGGILKPEQARRAAACGASGICVLRGLGDDPRLTVAALQQAIAEGWQEAQARAGQPVARLHPTLDTAA